MAIAPVVISFLAQGMPQVQQAFKSIHDAAIRAERAQQVEADRTARTVKKSSDDRAKMQIAAMKKVDAWERQARAAGEREAARAAAAETRTKDRAAKEQERIIAREALAKARIHRQAISEVEKIEERARANNRRRLDAETRDRERAAAHWVKTREREQASERRGRERIFGSIVGNAGRGVLAGMGRVANTTMGMANIAGQLGGGFTIAGALERQLGAQRAAANVAASTMGQDVRTAEILNAAKATGARYGIDTEDAVAAIAKYKDLTGDTRRGMAILPEIAKLGTAFGADIGQLAENAGNISMSAPDMSNADVMRLLRVQTAQGAAGAVELKDMARFGSRLTAGASLFGGDRSENIAAMGAIAQVARQHGGASSPAEAAMAAQRFATDVQKHARDLEAQGIKVSDGKGGLRSAKEIMGDMIDKSGGDVTKLTQFGLGERGIRALTGFSDVYRSAGGGEQGRKAVAAEWAKYTTGVSDAEIDKRANARMLEPDKKLEQAFVQLRQKVGEDLLPVFINMIPAIKELVPQFVDAAKVGLPAFTDLLKSVAKFAKDYDWLVKDIAAHPIGSLMALEIGKAALPTLLPELFRKVFAALNLPVPGGGGGGGGARPPGPGGNVGALGVGVITTAAAIAYNGYENYQAGDKRAGEMAAAVRSGALTSDAAAAEVAAAKGRIDKQNSFGSQIAEIGTNTFLGPAAGFYNSYKHAQGAGDYALTGSKELESAIRENSAALRENSQAVGARPANNSGSNGTGRSEPIINR